jgi:hypothetical protein
LLRGLATVAVGVFHLDGQLGKGFAKARDEHDGIEPKAIHAHRCTRDFAHRAAYGNEWFRVIRVAHGHKGADQSCAAIVDVGHLL